MTIKTIRNVDDETWYRFKNLAVKHRVEMGELLEKMIIEYENESKEFWEDILSGDRILNDKEADEIIKHTSKLRREKGFRI